MRVESSKQRCPALCIPLGYSIVFLYIAIIALITKPIITAIIDNYHILQTNRMNMHQYYIPDHFQL